MDKVLLISKYRHVHLSIFFFQAEDGIRDLYVTGVQTCALPIWCRIQREICSGDREMPRIERHGKIRAAAFFVGRDSHTRRRTPPHLCCAPVCASRSRCARKNAHIRLDASILLLVRPTNHSGSGWPPGPVWPPPLMV